MSCQGKLVDRLLKNTVLISFLTLCSRVLGLVRDAVVAMMFGTSVLTDTFIIAFRPFDLIRKMFAEGIFGVSFIPVFASERERNGSKSAFNLAVSLFWVLTVSAVFIVLVCLLLGPFLLLVIAPGFTQGSYEYTLTYTLLKIMLPYFSFIMTSALLMSVLNCFGNFKVPALAPVVFNLTVIVFALCVTGFLDPPVLGLAIGVTIGGILQLSIQIPALVKCGFFKQSRFFTFHGKTWKVIRLMLPCMIGAAGYQVNIMVASFFASTLDEGSISFLYFSDRLVQLPLALFAISAATVFLPELAKKAAAGDMDLVGQIITRGICMVWYLTIPAMAGLMALNHSIVVFLFGRGMFDSVAAQHTSQCLFYLVSGLWAFAGTRLLVTLHFAVHSVRIPFCSGILSIMVNLLLCKVLIGSFGLNGLVISVSTAAVAGFFFLCINLPGSVRLEKKILVVSACRSIFLSAIMFFLVKLVSGWMAPWQTEDMGAAAVTILGICTGIGFYLGASFLTSNPELKQLINGIKNKK